MSNSRAGEHGAQDDPADFSFTKAVEDVSQHGNAQSEALRERQETLSSLQAVLSDVERKGETAEQELTSKTREILILEGEMQLLESRSRDMRDRCVSISRDNTHLRAEIGEEEEKARAALAGFKGYRDKMQGHRAAVLRAASQTKVHKELEERRALVRMLKQKREELRRDLENPDGNAAQMAKAETDALKREISAMRKTTAEKRERLRKESETQAQIKKDIEIQHRRYNAIVKRLHCQLRRAKAANREMSEDVYHMERQLAELRRQVEH